LKKSNNRHFSSTHSVVLTASTDFFLIARIEMSRNSSILFFLSVSQPIHNFSVIFFEAKNNTMKKKVDA
jgi:hypothetical protein